MAKALTKLEAVDASVGDKHQSRTFWRGLKRKAVSFDFLSNGGTEMAFGSTSLSQGVALRFAGTDCPLLMEFKSQDFKSRGRDIQFLSVYGADEQEVLYPPLTYLRCTGARKIDAQVAGEDTKILVVTEEPAL
jgi:hypothetical protein